MTAKVKQLLEAGKKLPPKQRRELANRLMDSVFFEEPPEISPEWEAEIKRRLDEIDSGKAEFVPWETVRKKLNKIVEDARRAKRPATRRNGNVRGSTVVPPSWFTE